LDTNKLATFGQGKLTLRQIEIADSLLITAVNYYNNKVKRGDNLIYLSDQEYSDYLKLDSSRKLIYPYLTKRGEIIKRDLNKLPAEQKERINLLIKDKDIIEQKFCELEKKGYKELSDSVVLSWGSTGIINLSDYYRQYQFFGSGQDNNTWILASCFCSEIISFLDKSSSNFKIDWKKQPLTVQDGGNCVFLIQLNLKTKKAYHMRVNGL